VNRPARNTLFGMVLCMVLAGAYSCKARAEADFDSGNYMLLHCEHFVQRSEKFDVWDGECGGTINAFLFLGSELPDGFKVCRPKKSTPQQAGRIVLAYLNAHPQTLHQNYRGLILTALHEAWPCE